MITLTKKVLFPVVILTVLMAVIFAPAYAQKTSEVTPHETLFFEAENFTMHDDGWRVQKNHIVRAASRTTALSGSSGKVDGVATQQVTISQAGVWRIWVRYMEYQRQSYGLGPFVVDVLQGQKAVATQDFHLAHTKARSKEFVWRSFDVNLQPGQYTLQLRKYQNKNSNGYTRKVDCFLLTTDKTLKPSIDPYGPQTWMKVTLGDGYEKPVRIQVFADHFRAPYYARFQVGKGYLGTKGIPEKSQLSNGESTGWLNISETIYQDSGAMLRIKPSIGPRTQAETFKGIIQFATKPDDTAVIKTFKVNRSPSTITIVVPPNLESKANIAKLRSDIEIANAYGAIADDFDWSTAGEKPVKFPLLVTAAINPDEMGSNVVERELKTLSYFGFNGIGSDSFFEKYGYTHKKISGVGWDNKNSYSDPDLAEIRSRADSVYASQVEQGIKAKDIAFAMLRDEPTGEPLSKIVNDKASNDGLRAWIKRMNLMPADLLVNSWDDVKLVTDKEKEKFPGLYYYSERYRTVALGNFIAAHKDAVLDNWKSNFPAVVNFSDGAISGANFYKQGVDYFTLLHDTDQNAMWSEDWGNYAATYQHTAYNVELMRSAAQRKGQTLGQFLIVYYGRKGYDIRLKAVSEVARGVKVLNSFFYGPVWAGHTPSAWSNVTDIWKDHAELNHEIGAVEDDLLPAMPQKAEVAILYSSASDIWNQDNAIYGHERMNTWLALTHAQIPVDVVGEGDVAIGGLAGYKVCYLADPNVTRAAATKLAAWVKAGGTLIMTAGAGERDEYNRPSKMLNELLPYQRNATETLQSYHGAGYRLYRLNSQGVVSTSFGDTDVLSVKQTFANVKAQNGVSVKSTFKDGTPAAIKSPFGQGAVISMGYLPAVAYMRKALLTQGIVSDKMEEIEDNNGIPSPDDEEMFSIETKSYNPWEYPSGIRESIVAPLKAAHVNPPIVCSVPLVDAVYMTGGMNLLVPLANYTLVPIENMTLDITVEKPVRKVKSVYQDDIKFHKIGDNKIRINMPLDCTDFVTVEY